MHDATIKINKPLVSVFIRCGKGISLSSSVMKTVILGSILKEMHEYDFVPEKESTKLRTVSTESFPAALGIWSF
jgi:hypothetical protein